MADHHIPMTEQYDRAFRIGIILNVLYVLLEGAAGFLFGSMALLSDAGHNVSDVLALVLAWGAFWLSRSVPTRTRTFGMKRATILASLFSALTLCVALGAIIWEAAQRLFQPLPTDGLIVFWVAAAGVLINGVTAWMFLGGHKTDLNIKGAFLHMAGDTLVSFGVVLAGLLMHVTGWLWIDPVVAIAVGLIILYSGFDLLRESLDLAMDAVPRHINLSEVRAFLQGLEGVRDVHDLHVWAMSTQETALSVHLVLNGPPVDQKLVTEIAERLMARFSIQHPTIQFEYGPEARCASTAAPCAEPVGDLVRLSKG